MQRNQVRISKMMEANGPLSSTVGMLVSWATS